MSRQKPITKARVFVLSDLNRYYLFVFMMFFLLSGLFISKNILAFSSDFKAEYSHSIGYAQQRQQDNFSKAKMAFENQDYVYSARLLRSLAENGHIQSQYILATQYDAGLGVKQNAFSSFYWYSLAAKAGVHIAQHNLAVAYAQGHGISADLDKAIIWWKRAAKAGNSDSQYNLGIIYAAGRDSVKPDLEQALKWWRMAAINGDAAAQFNLGALYANGIGMSSRTCEALRWWKKSAANGFVQAEMALAILENKNDYDLCR